MIAKIIEYCSGKPVPTILGVLFFVGMGWFYMHKIPLDAIPDLSDTQVIVYSRWNASPDIMEDQVTYPIVTSLLGTPKVKDIRGISAFGVSYIYVIFEDGVDLYWARSRVMEYLSKILPGLPEGVRTELGPDATGVGWAYQYALKDTSGKNSLARLRSLQDWFLKYQLQSVPGVAEIASFGGFENQYQIQIDPDSLRTYNISLSQVAKAVRQGNKETGAGIIEFSGTEYIVRAGGDVKNRKDIENIVVGVRKNGIPVYVKNVARVTFGPAGRRGVGELDGMGDTVGGIVVMRFGENAYRVIDNVKKKLDELRPALPEGVSIVETYDRSELINRSIATLTKKIIWEMLMVALVIAVFLFHLPGTLIPVLALPASVVISFVLMYMMNISANIMSLGGIAIAIGAMVDASIVVVDNCHKKIEEWKIGGRKESINSVIVGAIKEVSPASFYSLLVIAVSFLPIFALEAQEGRLFKPLAWTKTLSMLVASVLSISLVPALSIVLFRGKNLNIKSEEEHPVSKFLFAFYGPVVDWVVEHRKKVVVMAFAMVVATIPIWFKLGTEFMPPLNEGTILYMPTTMPGISITQAGDILQRQDRILKSFPGSGECARKGGACRYRYGSGASFHDGDGSCS